MPIFKNKDNRIPMYLPMDAFSGFRSRFPVLTQYTYLNTAAWGLLHDGLLEWRQEYDLDYLIGGSITKIKFLSLLKDTRENLGQFFNCPPGNIALCPNFSLGLNLLLEGLDSSNRVLMLEGDYPSLNWPFESRGFPMEELPQGPDLEDRIISYLRQSGADVLALSLVQWINGLMISPEFLRSLKEEYPDLLIIADATQFAGAYQLDFSSSGIDVLGGSGYKWLLGGNGNGFVLLSEASKTRFQLYSIGFNSMDHDIASKEDIPFARKLEPGHLDTLCFGSLNYGLGLLQELGMKLVDQYNRDLGGKVKRALEELQLLDHTISTREAHSTIFNIPEPGGRYRHLKKHGIVCSPRGGGIRVSFHCYNSENDLDKLIEVLKSGP
jgi:cysteine desulfurase/selenocysteine lyase